MACPLAAQGIACKKGDVRRAPGPMGVGAAATTLPDEGESASKTAIGRLMQAELEICNQIQALLAVTPEHEHQRRAELVRLWHWHHNAQEHLRQARLGLPGPAKEGRRWANPAVVATAVSLLAMLLSDRLHAWTEIRFSVVVLAVLLVASGYMAPRMMSRLLTLVTILSFLCGLVMDVARSDAELRSAVILIGEPHAAVVLNGIALAAGATLGLQPSSSLSPREKYVAAALYLLIAVGDGLVCYCRTSGTADAWVGQGLSGFVVFVVVLSVSFLGGMLVRRGLDARHRPRPEC